MGRRLRPAYGGPRHTRIVSQDARPDPGRVKTPVLQLAAFNKTMPRFGTTRDAFVQRLESQLANIPKHQLAVIDDSRHFIMFDSPEKMLKTIDEFLAHP